ncbi:hypothetical protein BD324DRAFT_650521 [Kockovaella imperatae]|uniref:F-box domain-containing protein n=1 Tax=Kockovaella imperatae TaxID=4999 RepID=A0A1Y1UIW7_9TREE|nr:hypothetical protein BD324DRAFT_650521 [Kockovaella imperatae]ORX37981.1 hypothetical protein BD324DRAFT_650521 [Kockovaella imperatae]
MSLMSLPDEILRNVVRQLDQVSQLVLAQTSRPLQYLAEEELYCSLADSFFCAHRQFDHERGLRAKHAKLLSSLKGCDHRRAYVKTLSVTLYPFVVQEPIAKTLKLTAGSLRSLRLEQTATCFPPPILSDLNITFQNLAPLPHLTHLELTLSFMVTPLLNQLLKLAPQLSSLTFRRPSLPHFDPRPFGLDTTLVLPHLKNFKAEKMSKSNLMVVVDLLRLLPSLEALSLSSITMLHDSKLWLPVVEHLRPRAIQSLQVGFSSMWDFDARGGFLHVKELTLRWDYDDCWFPLLQDICVPPLPMLESLTFEAIQGLQHKLLHGCQRARVDLSDGITSRTIPSSLVARIMAAPRLEQIFFLPPQQDYLQDPSVEHVEFVEIHRGSLRESGIEPGLALRVFSHVLDHGEGLQSHLREPHPPFKFNVNISEAFNRF